jgi:hypothetical protein
MRFIFILLSIEMFCFIGFSQDKRPSQAQIQAQMKETIDHAKQELADLKKQIADAKANNEDPESIKEMEKQLTSVQKMLSMLEGTDLSGKSIPKSLPAAKKIEPPYVSPFTPIVLKQPIPIPAAKDAKDELLWYKGKKIDANTLITTTGLIVRYDKTKSRIIFQPNKQVDTDYYNLVNTLAQTPRMKNDFVVRMDQLPNNFFMYPEIKKAYDEFDLIRDLFYDLGRNTIEMPGLASPNINSPASQGLYRDQEGYLGQLIQGLIQYMRNLPSVQNIELPPKRPNSLCECNPNEENKKYQLELQQWLPEFWSEEYYIIDKVVGIYANRENLKARSTQYVDPAGLLETMNEAMALALRRMKQKLNELANKYNNGTIDVEDGLVYATEVLRIRLEILFDVNDPEIVSEKHIASRLLELIKESIFSDIFERRIQEWKASRNFKEVFNYSRYISHEYNKTYLQSSYNVNKDFFETWMEGLKKFNRFTLSMKIDFDFQMGTDKDILMVANGSMESDRIIVSLGLAEDCKKFDLHVTDVNYRDRSTSGEEFKIPITVTKGEKDYLDDQLPPFQYAGPEKMGMVFPVFKLNLCGEESEAKMNILSYNPSDIERHNRDDPKKVYTIDMLGYANKMFLALKKTSANVDQLISTAGEMMNMNSSSLPESTGNAVLDKMKMDYLMNKKRYDLQYSLSQIGETGGTIVNLGQLSGQGSVLLRQTFDLADPNDQDKPALILKHGYLTIEIIHTPQ